MVVGANGRAKFTGAVYVYDLASGDGSRAHHWRRLRLVGRDSHPAEQKKRGELRLVNRGSGFGFSCAMDRSGDMLFVGAPGHDLQKGTVHAFSFDPEHRTWEEVARIDAPEKRSSDSFGWALSASADGGTLAISAKGRRANNGEVFIFHKIENWNGRNDGSGPFVLSARIPPPDFTDTAGPRGIRIRNNFGASLGMTADGHLIAVGSTGFNREQGAVYILRRVDGERQATDSGNGGWELVQRLVSPTPADFSFFGFKLSMDADGQTIAVGADGEENYKGAAYLFNRKNDSYSSHPVILKGESRQDEDNYGGSISVSSNGQVLVIGSPGARRRGEVDHGALYIYSRTETAQKETSWKLVSKEGLPDVDARKGAYYSWSTALSGNGGRLLASAPESGILTVARVTGVLETPVETAESISNSKKLQQSSHLDMNSISRSLHIHDEL